MARSICFQRAARSRLIQSVAGVKVEASVARPRQSSHSQLALTGSSARLCAGQLAARLIQFTSRPQPHAHTSRHARTNTSCCFFSVLSRRRQWEERAGRGGSRSASKRESSPQTSCASLSLCGPVLILFPANQSAPTTLDATRRDATRC